MEQQQNRLLTTDSILSHFGGDGGHFGGGLKCDLLAPNLQFQSLYHLYRLKTENSPWHRRNVGGYLNTETCMSKSGPESQNQNKARTPIIVLYFKLSLRMNSSFIISMSGVYSYMCGLKFLLFAGLIMSKLFQA